MQIETKNIDMEIDFPCNIEKIEEKLSKNGIKPLRFAVVNVKDNVLTVNVTFVNS